MRPQKWTEDKVDRIIQMRNSGHAGADIAAVFGTSRGNIYNVISKYVPEKKSVAGIHRNASVDVGGEWLGIVRDATGVDLVGYERRRPVAMLRHAFCLAMVNDGHSLPNVGFLLGRDHTTVWNSVTRARGSPALEAVAMAISAGDLAAIATAFERWS